jgi:arylformamidase
MFQRLAAALILSVAVSAQAGKQSAEWIDVSMAVDPEKTPVYQGDPAPKFDWTLSMQKGDKLNLSNLQFGAHTGTHIDAPLHFIKDGKPVDQIPLENLVGEALVIDIGRDAQMIDAKALATAKWKAAKRILFRTRNSYEGLASQKEFHKDFVAIAPDAAKLLADAGVLAVGVDYLSAEKFGSEKPEAHLTLLGKNVAIIEGLDLSKVSAGRYQMFAAPVKLAGREGSPARVILRKAP